MTANVFSSSYTSTMMVRSIRHQQPHRDRHAGYAVQLHAQSDRPRPLSFRSDLSAESATSAVRGNGVGTVAASVR